jgi:hypothetical protein
MASEVFFPLLLDNPLVKAAITGLAASIGKALGESGLRQLGQSGVQLIDGAGNLTQQARDFLFPIAQTYIENYAKRHGTLKVLGMGGPVGLESLYTQVKLHTEIIQTYSSLDAQETAFRKKVPINADRVSGLDVANTCQYLMVLGGPGTGKTTFLRKVGIEALKQGRGDYRHSLIPVFLELRKFRWETSENIDIETRIAEEFEHCCLQEYRDFTRKFLEQGRLLILFDGLDEVPIEFLGQVTTAIKNLVDRYDKNRFIVSCRIAAYRDYHSFNRFTDVAIADFDDQQIRSFIGSWFDSHNQKEWGQKCWAKLTSVDNTATRELAKNPLLLTLICILFQKQGEFPTKRATLYDRALSTLLSEWDASKELTRPQQYKGLDTKCKEVMLAEIAYSNFIANNLFFQQGEIANQIEKILREMLTEEKRIHGRGVLRAIEEQHGILVNRYDDIYSFSHLSLQEFLTAKHVVDNTLNLTELVADHLCEESWREVFLLLGGLRKADDLLLAIEQQIQTYISTPKLQQLLAWVEQFSDSTPGNIQPVGKRAIAYANAYANAIANTNVIDINITNDNPIAIAKAYANTNANAIANANAITYSIAIANAIANANANANATANTNTDRIDTDNTRATDNANAHAMTNASSITISNAYTDVRDSAIAIANAYANVYAYVYANAYAREFSSTNAIVNANTIDKFIHYAQWAVKFEIYRGLDLQGIINELQQLKESSPDENDSEQAQQSFARRLIEIWLTGFNLTSNMVNLSEDEIKALDNYLYANRLLVECERAAVRRSPEVWSQIESRMWKIA